MPFKTVRPLLRTFDTRTCKPPPKRAVAELLTPEHKAWALEVKRRAGWRCQEIVDGRRCTNAHPGHRMYADHIRERSDGGARLDLANGMCRCASHHTMKTTAERAKRMSSC